MEQEFFDVFADMDVARSQDAALRIMQEDTTGRNAGAVWRPEPEQIELKEATA